MVDADIANPVVGNATHPLVFWLVTNIREGNMSTGNDIDQHWYFFKGCKIGFVMSQCMRFPSIWHFDMYRLGRASTASF